MTSKTLNRLLYATGFAVLTDWLHRNYLRALPGFQAIQWILVASTALLLSIGMFASSHALITRPQERKTLLGHCFGFSAIAGYLVVAQVFAYLILLQGLEVNLDPDPLPKIIEKAYATDSPAISSNLAKTIWLAHGIRVPHLDAEGRRFILFAPEESLRKKRDDAQETQRRIAEVRGQLFRALRHFPCSPIIFVGTALLVVVVGAVWMTFRRPTSPKQPVEGLSAQPIPSDRQSY